MLAAKQKQLKSMGKGNTPMAADEISDNDQNAIYETKDLSPSSPSSLIHSIKMMWMMCTLQFGMHTGKDTHDIRWADVESKTCWWLLRIPCVHTGTANKDPGSNPRDIRKKSRAYAVPKVTDWGFRSTTGASLLIGKHSLNWNSNGFTLIIYPYMVYIFHTTKNTVFGVPWLLFYFSSPIQWKPVWTV